MPVKFRFRWIPFVAAVAAAAVGISLGQWQTRRAVEKELIEARLQERESAAPVVIDGKRYTSDEVEYRRVQVRGEFMHDWNVYLDNRPHNGAAGFYVLTPMKIAGSDSNVLVARGWVKRDAADRTKLPAIPVPEGMVSIEGIARHTPGHVMQLGKDPALQPGAIVQNADADEVGKAAGLKMQPFIVEQLSDSRDGLVRDWPRPSLGVEKHRGYAFQWYALAATALIFFVVTGFRRGAN
ncbi:SURF1 family protein [Herbaspirillum sp. HC18]|nr:SURF1 family protein [Herbaspirillum sp. HC18]